MDSKLNDLSKVEWFLMNICWAKGKVTGRDIYDETLKQKKRSYQAVKTMLDRLVTKGYLRREKFGPLWLYEPAIARAKILAKAIETFAGSVLDNTFSPLIAYFAKNENLSREEIKALKNLLDKEDED